MARLPETDNRDELRRRKIANRQGQPMRSAGELAQVEAAVDAAEAAEAEVDAEAEGSIGMPQAGGGA